MDDLVCFHIASFILKFLIPSFSWELGKIVFSMCISLQNWDLINSLPMIPLDKPKDAITWY